MARTKKQSSIQYKPGGQSSPRQTGLQAFQANRFAEAIRIWSRLGGSDPALRAAIAEAHFRRALADPGSEAALADLRAASALEPNDARYSFHTGRLLHQRGELAEASELYRRALAADPGMQPAAQLLAAAALEQNPRAELAQLPGYTPAIGQALAPAQALLRASAPPPGDDSALARFWHGLGQLAAGRPARATRWPTRAP